MWEVGDVRPGEQEVQQVWFVVCRGEGRRCVPGRGGGDGGVGVVVCAGMSCVYARAVAVARLRALLRSLYREYCSMYGL